jgi:hypothetical protein
MKENIHGNNKYTANLRDKNYNQVDSWVKKKYYAIQIASDWTWPTQYDYA